MSLITKKTAPSFEIHGALFSGLASPSRGSAENSVWIVTLPGSTPGMPHQVTREEIFVGVDGIATLRVGPDSYTISAGDAVVVPPHTELELSVPGPEPFKAVVILPVGGQAILPGQAAFTPPWAQ